MQPNSSGKSLPWARIGLSVLCFVLAVILILGIFVTAFIESTLNKLTRPPEDGPGYSDPTDFEGTEPTDFEFADPSDPIEFLDPTEPEFTLPADDDPQSPTIPTGMTEPTVAPTVPKPKPQPKPVELIDSPDIVNIMLIGMDRRPEENYRTRSDSMILLTFNVKKNTLVMTSFMRDIYVQIPNKGGNKLNAAYSYGGMKLLSSTMKSNFGIVVNNYVTVDFVSFPKVIDALGGVDIELRQDEADHLNGKYGFKLSAGMQHLNGDQALQYSRIRKIGDDFERTLRQRKLLTSLMNTYKGKGLSQITDMLNAVLPLVQTNMDNSTIMRYAIDFFPILVNGNVTSQRIPVSGSYRNANVGKITSTLVLSMDENLKLLRKTLLK